MQCHKLLLNLGDLSQVDSSGVSINNLPRINQKKVSIVPDTHTVSEQAHVEVSSFEARLPLRSPNAVSLEAKHRIEQ
jgi:hypothetical protein